MKKTELAIERCKTISTLQKILGGKWKIEILYYPSAIILQWSLSIYLKKYNKKEVMT